MIILETTRDAKCKDCNNLRRYYNGKQKRHHCIKIYQDKCLNDLICENNFDFNPSGTPLSFPSINNPHKQ